MTTNGDETCKGLLDMQIMNVFEEQEDKFSFPITSQKEARDFVRLLNKQGCTYDVISKEVNEDEESFRDWRLGGGRVEIGKHVIERINKPIGDTIFSDSEMDEKDRRNSLRDFYQFSFEEDEVPGTPKSKINIRPEAQCKSIAAKESFHAAQNSNGLSKLISTSIQLPETSTSDPKNLQAPRDNASVSVKITLKTEAEKLSSISMTEVKELKLSSPPLRKPSGDSQQPEARQTQTVEQRVFPITAISQNSTTKSSQSSEPLNLNDKTNNQITKSQLDCLKSPVRNSSATAETEGPKFSDRITRLENSATSKPSLFSSNRISSPPTNLPTAKVTSQTSRSSSTVSSPTSTTAGPNIKSPTESISGDDPERPPSPVTTSPYYKPLVVSFKLEEIEQMLNYNSDDQEELKKDFGPKNAPGFIYVFSDIPGPSLSVKKSTKFRTKIGVSRDPLKRLQQAMLFNPDIRMIASISISSMKDCSPLLKEKLKPYLMRGKLDWYWANLNSIFDAVGSVVHKIH